MKKKTAVKKKKKQILRIRLPGLPRKPSFKYLCPECDAGFHQGKSLAAHRRKEHHKKAIECLSCNKTFTRYFDLRRHIRTKHSHGVRRFKCPKCEYYNLRKDPIQRHLVDVHRFQQGNLPDIPLIPASRTSEGENLDKPLRPTCDPISTLTHMDPVRSHPWTERQFHNLPSPSLKSPSMTTIPTTTRYSPATSDVSNDSLHLNTPPDPPIVTEPRPEVFSNDSQTLKVDDATMELSEGLVVNHPNSSNSIIYLVDDATGQLFTAMGPSETILDHPLAITNTKDTDPDNPPSRTIDSSTQPPDSDDIASSNTTTFEVPLQICDPMDTVTVETVQPESYLQKVKAAEVYVPSDTSPTTADRGTPTEQYYKTFPQDLHPLVRGHQRRGTTHPTLWLLLRSGRPTLPDGLLYFPEDYN